MKDILLSDYQDCVNKMLVRNKSILDILSKMDITQGKIQRSIAKSVTHCGCIEIDAKKREKAETLEDYKKYGDFHVNKHLCDECKNNLEKEMGNHLFYFAALCNALDVDMYDIILKEKQNLETLGKFSLR